MPWTTVPWLYLLPNSFDSLLLRLVFVHPAGSHESTEARTRDECCEQQVKVGSNILWLVSKNKNIGHKIVLPRTLQKEQSTRVSNWQT